MNLIPFIIAAILSIQFLLNVVSGLLIMHIHNQKNKWMRQSNHLEKSHFRISSNLQRLEDAVRREGYYIDYHVDSENYNHVKGIRQSD